MRLGNTLSGEQSVLRCDSRLREEMRDRQSKGAKTVIGFWLSTFAAFSAMAENLLCYSQICRMRYAE